MKLAFILVVLLSSVGFALTHNDAPIGTPRVVNRTFTATPAECLAKMPTTGGPRQTWKCVFYDTTVNQGFSFNSALEFKDTGAPSVPGLARDIIIDIESHPNGGSVGVRAPDVSHPGYSRMISYDEVKTLMNGLGSRAFTFRGTFLVVP